MRRRLYTMLVGIAMIMEGMERIYSDIGEYSSKIAIKKSKHLFSSSKTLYQNPNIKMRSYYNKVPRKNKFSTISLKGKEIKANNRRKNIEDKLKRK